jgi:hypothetical protein
MAELTLKDIARASIDRRGALIYRLPKDDVAGGGDSNAFNFGLWCGSCAKFLGRLGVFALKPAGMNGQLVPHRTAHCTECHHTSLIVVEQGRERVKELLLAGRDAGGRCACGSVADVQVEGKDDGGVVGALSIEELRARNRPH